MGVRDQLNSAMTNVTGIKGMLDVEMRNEIIQLTHDKVRKGDYQGLEEASRSLGDRYKSLCQGLDEAHTMLSLVYDEYRKMHDPEAVRVAPKKDKVATPKEVAEKFDYKGMDFDRFIVCYVHDNPLPRTNAVMTICAKARMYGCGPKVGRGQSWGHLAERLISEYIRSGILYVDKTPDGLILKARE